MQAAGDVRDVILRAAARLNVPIRWLPDRLAEQNFNLEEPPSRASPWVPILLGHLQTFVERLVDMSALTPADVHQVRAYLQYLVMLIQHNLQVPLGGQTAPAVTGSSQCSLCVVAQLEEGPLKEASLAVSKLALATHISEKCMVILSCTPSMWGNLLQPVI